MANSALPKLECEPKRLTCDSPWAWKTKPSTRGTLARLTRVFKSKFPSIAKLVSRFPSVEDVQAIALLTFQAFRNHVLCAFLPKLPEHDSKTMNALYAFSQVKSDTHQNICAFNFVVKKGTETIITSSDTGFCIKALTYLLFMAIAMFMLRAFFIVPTLIRLLAFLGYIAFRVPMPDHLTWTQCNYRIDSFVWVFVCLLLRTTIVLYSVLVYPCIFMFARGRVTIQVTKMHILKNIQSAQLAPLKGKSS